MDIRELLVQMRANDKDLSVSKATGIDRRTVKKYRAWATEQGLLGDEPLPSLEELQVLAVATLEPPPPPQNVSTVEPYREQVVKLKRENVEMAAIWERLKERGYTGSYSSVRRFVRRLEADEPEVFVRVETQPGEEAQVDFGYAGMMIDPSDGRERRAWEFVMTLSWSRHQYVEFVFDQRVETWLRLHANAFEFFGGVPERVVIDNLKAAIVKACWDDPQVQQAYRECAEHYGFLIGPCRPYTPRHKGKVEKGGVHYVKRNFLAGRALTTITQANREVRIWCSETAGRRVHGTTKEQPLVRFAEERERLKPLPETRYDMAVWKVAKLHRDCHIVFEQAYYSAPFHLVGQELRVRGGLRDVRIYTMDYQLVATHERASKPGERLSNLDHLPPEKVPGLTLTREDTCERADAVGPATRQVVDTLLEDPVIDRLRMVGRLLRLADDYGAVRLEAACARALHFNDPTFKTIKEILKKGLDADELPAPLASAPPASTFARSVEELLGRLFARREVASWN